MPHSKAASVICCWQVYFKTRWVIHHPDRWQPAIGIDRESCSLSSYGVSKTKGRRAHRRGRHWRRRWPVDDRGNERSCSHAEYDRLIGLTI